MIQIKNINVGLYGIAIKEKEVLADEAKFNKFFHSAKAYIDKHTYVGYVIIMYESPEVRDITFVLAKVMGYKTAVAIPDVLMVEGRSLRE